LDDAAHDCANDQSEREEKDNIRHIHVDSIVTSVRELSDRS